MLFRPIEFPTSVLDQAFDEDILAGAQIDHATLVVRDQRNAPHTADCDGIRDFELAVG